MGWDYQHYDYFADLDKVWSRPHTLIE
jgi:hypothetical protein